MTGLAATAHPGGHEHRAGRRLWLVRHGETVGDSSVRYYGATDVALSDIGRGQVARLAALLAARTFDAVVHSPMARATESAQIVVGALHAQPSLVEAESQLREVDFGELEGLTAAEIAEQRPEFWAQWRAGQIDTYPGGESLAGFRARVATGIDAVLARHPRGDLCVVAHRGVIKSALVHLLGLPWPMVRRWSLDLGSVSIVVEDDGGWVLDRYNLTGADVAPR